MTHMRTNRIVLGLFDTVSEAGQSVQDVIGIGIPRNRISLLARQDAGPNRALRAMSFASAAAAGETPVEEAASCRDAVPEVSGDTLAGMVTEDREAGAGVLWARLDAVGIILDFLPLPGVGWIMAAGPLSTILRSPYAGLGAAPALLGATFGPTAAGLIGTLVHIRLSEEYAHLYIEGVRRGGTLVMVFAETEDLVADIRSVLHYNNAVNICERGSIPSVVNPGEIREENLWATSRGMRDAEEEDFTRRAMERWDTDGDQSYWSPETIEQKVTAAPLPEVESGRPAEWDTGEAMVPRFAPFDAEFRRHYAMLPGAQRDIPYERYQTAYYYGLELAIAYCFRKGRTGEAIVWDSIAASAKEEWDRDPHDMPWELFQDAVRYGWQMGVDSRVAETRPGQDVRLWGGVISGARNDRSGPRNRREP